MRRFQCTVCPDQALMIMGAHNSSTIKNWGWVVTWRRYLNGLAIPRQVSIPDAKLAASVYRIDLYRRFTRASLGPAHGGEGCYMLESRLTRGLVANLPKCLSLVVHKFSKCGHLLGTILYINRLLNSKGLLSFLYRMPTKVLMMNTWVLNQPKRAMVLYVVTLISYLCM